MVKKYIVITALCILSLNGTNQQEWNAHDYAEGNKIQYQSALYLLEKNNITVQEKHILDVGCGTGEISAYMAQFAASVFGFDASNNMVQWAQKNFATHNTSFAQCRVEDFSSTQKYDLATMFFCFHWFADKQKALNNVSASLKNNGEFFGTFSTSNMPEQPRHAIIKNMMEKWNVQNNFDQSMGRSAVTPEDLKTMLANAGFDIIICELQSRDIFFIDRSDVENFNRPILMSRPFIQEMQKEQREQFFLEYIENLLPVLANNETGQFMMKMHVTIVHARKKQHTHEK